MIFHTTSKKPVLLIGNGTRESGALDLIYELFGKTKIPVLTSINTVDMVCEENRIGFIGTYGHRISNLILAECDLVIAVGIRLGLRQIGHNKELFAPKAKLIRADIDQFELSRQIKENEEKYLIDASDFIRRLLDEKIQSYADWFDRCKRAASLLDGVDDTLGNKVIKKIGKLLPSEPIVTVDIGQNMCWVAQSLTLKGRKGRILIGGSYGAMGVGLPYAIGACFANNKSAVFCITGDGGLQMNIQELEAVSSEHLPVKIIVINNHELGKISEIQEKSYESRFAQTTEESGYSVPNFKNIAEAYGIKATAIDSLNDLEKYENWFYDNEPCLIDLTIPRSTKLIPKIEFNSMEVYPEINNSILMKVKSIISH